MIIDLVTLKNHFWCHHCARGLFFPATCTTHADTVEVNGSDDVANMDDLEVIEDLVL
jgi:hypothetical protein